MTPARELELLYIFVAGCTPERAHDLVLCYNSVRSIIDTIEIYKTATRGSLVPARN